MMVQKTYQGVPYTARSPTMSTVVARAEMPTMRPDIENSMAGANIAPPKRWIFCSIICLPDATCCASKNV